MENMKETVVMEEVMETVKGEKAMEVKPMTLREFYEAIVAGEVVTEEMKGIAAKKIEQLDKKNEYARNHKKSGNSKKVKENAEFKAQIMQAVSELVRGEVTAVKANEIAEATGLSTQKVSALARQLVEEGKLTVDEEKVKGGRLVKIYTSVDVELAA